MKEALLAHFAQVSDEERYHNLFLTPYLATLIRPSSEYRSQLRVLVPGAGLCRLAWDVAKLGLCCKTDSDF